MKSIKYYVLIPLILIVCWVVSLAMFRYLVRINQASPLATEREIERLENNEVRYTVPQAIKALQFALTCEGYDLAVDGIMGEFTYQAVTDWQIREWSEE